MTATGTEPATPAGKQTAAVNAPKRPPSARDMAGRKREYETIYILRPDSTTDVIAQVNQKIRTVIETGGGTLLKVDNWGKRKLAYEVKKQLKGIYLFFAYLGTAGIVEEVERNLRLTDSVIRYYSVKMGENIDPAVRVTEMTEESFTKAATPGPDEEAIATGQADARSPFEDDEGAFDFEEAVFGSADEPRGGRGEG
jgi:small subunit ribosomal protein S6